MLEVQGYWNVPVTGKIVAFVYSFETTAGNNFARKREIQGLFAIYHLRFSRMISLERTKTVLPVQGATVFIKQNKTFCQWMLFVQNKAHDEVYNVNLT